jgi:UDP-3-O-[3-hydroxymyristoyl] glucosamine N-acyltransferase
MVHITAEIIAQLIGGKIEGNPSATVTRAGKIESSSSEDISFLANPKYSHFLYETKASIVIVSNDVLISQPVNATLIRHAMPARG